MINHHDAGLQHSDLQQASPDHQAPLPQDTQQAHAKYAIDIVFCIDCTGSMGPYLESVKKTATDFHVRLQRAMDAQAKGINQLRVKIVLFRDLGVERSEAIQQTQFYSLPAQTASFAEAVSSLYPGGGGDEPESALEALAIAFRSDWERTLDKRRHVVVMCTDASAHPLGKFPMPDTGQGHSVPRSIEDLQAIWGDEVDDGEMEFAAKRLLVFGPRLYPWDGVVGMFENCIFVPSIARAGMSDQDQDAVINAVAGSV